MAESATTVKSEYLPGFITNEVQLDNGVEETDNGLFLSNVYIPEEVMFHIFTFVEPKELLRNSVVCRRWNNMIKSNVLWMKIYKRKYNRKPKQLPWYLYYCLLSTNYFDTNLLLNGNGQEEFKYWDIKADGGDKCKIEDPPDGADSLCLDVPEFCNKTSCFATSYGTCYKLQQVNLANCKLLRYILDNYKPHIYLSEWTAGRFDCGCIYKLQCDFAIKNKPKNEYTQPYGTHLVEQWQGGKWKKVEITVMDYPEGVEGIIFKHEGRDTQYWAGHYGSKMAGGVVKLLFDSIEPLPTDDDGNEISKKFTEVRFTTTGQQRELSDQYGVWLGDYDYDNIVFYEDLLLSEDEYSEEAEVD